MRVVLTDSSEVRRLLPFLRGVCFAEGDGGGAGGGAPAGGGGTGAGGGGGTPAAPSGGGGGTPPAAPAAPAAPASSGAAPLSTQEVPSTLTDEGGKPVRELGEESEAFMSRFREWKDKQPRETPAVAETAEQKAAREKTEREKAAAASGAETPEQKAERERKERASQQETPEQKAERERKEREQQQQQPTAPEIYDLVPLATEDLSAALTKDPEATRAFLEKTGLTEDALLSTARLATRAAEYAAAGLPTIEAAKHAVTRAKAFHTMDDRFTSLKKGDVPGTMQFLNEVMLPMTYLRDENGEIMRDPQTKLPLTDGTTFTFLDNIDAMRGDFVARQIANAPANQLELALGYAVSNGAISKVLDAIAAAADKVGGDNGEQIKIAVDVLKGLGKAGSPASMENLPPEVRARLEEAERTKTEAQQRQAEMNRQEAEKEQARVQTFKNEVLTESSTEVDKVIDAFVDRSSLKDDKFMRPVVLQKVRDALYESMANDPLYLSQRDAITIGGANARTHKAWVALNVAEAKARLKSIAGPIFAEAGARILSRAEERGKTITQQKDASRMEPAGGTRTAAVSTPQQLDDHALVAKARENIRARGEETDTGAVMAEFRKLKAAQSGAAA